MDVAVSAGKKRSGDDGQRDGGTVVFRVYVPAQKVGPIIGKEGTNIKALREETHARIKISTSHSKSEDRLVVLSSRDYPATPEETSAAEKAFFSLYPRIVEGSAGAPGEAGTEAQGLSLRLLIAASQAGPVIGRGGSVIKELRESSGAQIRVTEGSFPSALPSDRMCQVTGTEAQLQAALSSIIAILRDHPPRESLEELEGGSQAGGGAAAAVAANAAAAAAAAAMVAQQQQQQQSYMSTAGLATWGYPGTAAPGMGTMAYGAAPLSLEDPYKRRRMQDPAAAAAAAALTMQSHGMGALGMGGTGAVAPVATVVPIAGEPQLRTEMRVATAAMGAVLGRGGSVINNIRQVSGATIKVWNAEADAQERLVEISGSSSQVATAQSLIQACVVNTK